jgi:small-conductance mechanosensitive channel
MFANDQLAAMHKRMTFEVQHVSAQLNQVAQEKNRIRQRLNTLADQEQQLNGCLLEINATCEWLGIDLTKEPPETSSEEAPPAAPLGSESGDEAAQTE